jgi:nitrous oxide reductase
MALLVECQLEGNKMSEGINHDRRRFLGTAAMTIASAQLGMIGSAKAQSSKTNTSFGSPKQINAGLLNVGYAEADRPLTRR